MSYLIFSSSHLFWTQAPRPAPELPFGTLVVARHRFWDAGSLAQVELLLVRPGRLRTFAVAGSVGADEVAVAEPRVVELALPGAKVVERLKVALGMQQEARLVRTQLVALRDLSEEKTIYQSWEEAF